MLDLRNAVKEQIEAFIPDLAWKEGHITGREVFPLIKLDIDNVSEQLNANRGTTGSWRVTLSIYDRFAPNCDFYESLDQSRDNIHDYQCWLRMFLKNIEFYCTKNKAGADLSKFESQGFTNWRLFPAPQTEHRLYVVQAVATFTASISNKYSIELFDTANMPNAKIPKWLQ